MYYFYTIFVILYSFSNISFFNRLISNSEKVHLQSILYIDCTYRYICVLMCVAIFGRIEIRPQELSVQPLVVAKSGSRARFDGWTCGPFLFTKLPINVRCQGFLFHPSSVRRLRGRARHTLLLSEYYHYIFFSQFLINLQA